ncbi:hypothetical protein G6F57_014809 [Rhizopus arrhizus]|nr:hypothetical protein G6F57_014809 [Rhizopus arrhizus]
MVAKALRARRHKPMLLFDLAVPRDIEAEVGTLNDAFLYTVDDLERAVEDNRRGRRPAAAAGGARRGRRGAGPPPSGGVHPPRGARGAGPAEAEAIIDLQVSRFIETQQASAHQAPLRQLRAFGEATRTELLERARQQLANGKPADEVLELLAHGLTNRLLHPPTAALRAAALSGDADLTRAAERLFPATPGYRHPPRREELERLLAEPDVVADNTRFRDLSREFAQLEPVAAALADEARAKADLAAAEGMRADPALRELADEEIAAAQTRLQQLEQELALLLVPRDPRDEGNLFLEVRAGTGGDEAAIFAGDLFRMKWWRAWSAVVRSRA